MKEKTTERKYREKEHQHTQIKHCIPINVFFLPPSLRKMVLFLSGRAGLASKCAQSKILKKTLTICGNIRAAGTRRMRENIIVH